METISTNVSQADLRELAFRDLEHSLATLRKTTEHLNAGSPLVRHMIGAINVAEISLKVLAMNSGDEIKALSGPLHGEPDEDFEAGGAVPVETTEAVVVNAPPVEDAAPVAEDAPVVETPAEPAGPASYAIAHAQVKKRCGAHSLGCTKPKINGNSNGRHEQLCPFFQTARLLEAGYQIDTIDDYVRALKKEHGKLPYRSADNMKKALDREHGSYRKVLLSVRRGIKARAKQVADKPAKAKKAG